MNKSLFAAIFTVLTVCSLSGQAALSNKPDIAGSKRILTLIDALISYPSDFSAQYTVTQEHPGQGSTVTKAVVFRRDREDKYLVLITEPSADKGKGYLKISSSMWLYDPVDRRFTVTSVRDKFQNSNVRMSDFTQSTLARDFRIVGQAAATLGAYATKVYDLEAVTETVTYPIRRIWVDTDNLVRKAEDYSLSGQLMRTIAIPSYQRLGSYFVPVSIVVIDALAGKMINGQFRNERTAIVVNQPSFAAVPDLVFTQSYLERMGQ